MRSWLTVLLAVTGYLLTACSQRSVDVKPPLPDWSGAWSSEDTPQVGNPGSGKDAPLNPKYASGRAMLTPGTGAAAHCVDPGMPAVMDHGVTFEFVFSPDRVTLIFQSGVIRRIYTDGRPHPDPANLYFNAEGHSIGHWEDSTLVVDTIGMDPKAELFRSSNMTVTKNTHIVERIFRKDPSTIQIDTTITDPALFTQVYSYSWSYGNVGNIDDFPTGCAQNNRDNGATVDLTPPPEGATL